jgi:hypothetical protein
VTLADKLRNENKSLWASVKDATVGAVTAIIEFKHLLTKVLGRVAGVVGEIIAHPIRFLGNLIAGVSDGIAGFRDNFLKHLKEGFVSWIFGAVAGAGITLPKTFDIKSIFGLIMQVLGLTWQGIRRIAVTEVGEPMVRTLEVVSEPIRVLITDGPHALWDWIKEKVSDLKNAFMEEVQRWLVTSVVKAGITWLMSLLTPASAFVKACKAIYDIIKFFVERGRQILTLVTAVVDSVADIAAGSTKAAAAKVEDALATSIPVAIGFLASLLGLGDISGTIRRFITKIREPVAKAVTWVIHKVVNLARSAGKLLGLGNDLPSKGTPEHDAQVTAGLGALDTAIRQMPNPASIEQAKSVARSVHNTHRVFSKLDVVDGGAVWAFEWEASQGSVLDGPSKAPAANASTDSSAGSIPEVTIRYTKKMGSSPRAAYTLKFFVDWLQEGGVPMQRGSRRPDDAKLRKRARKELELRGELLAGLDAMHLVDSSADPLPVLEPNRRAVYIFGHQSVNRSFGGQLGAQLRHLKVPVGGNYKIRFIGFDESDKVAPNFDVMWHETIKE